MKIKVLIVLLILGCFNAYADTIYVPENYPTIQGAINTALDGDIVLVAAGVYYENIDFAGKDITVRSQAGAKNTIIDANGGVHSVDFKSGETQNAAIDGFTLRNADNSGVYCGEGSSATIINNIITANKGYGIFFYIDSSPLISNNTITENGRFGIGYEYSFVSFAITNNIITANDKGGISCLNSGSAGVIANNIIIGNTTYGIYGGGGFPTIINNTIVGHYQSGISFSNIINGTLTVTNNIITHNGGYGIATDSETSSIVSYNNFWNNGDDTNGDGVGDENYGGNASVGEGDISVDPLFVDSENGDYHLGLTSSCIDAGQPEPGDYSDYFNEPEPNGNRINMGAYGNTLQAATSIGFQPNINGQIIDFIFGENNLPLQLGKINDYFNKEVLTLSAVASNSNAAVNIKVENLPSWLRYETNPNNPAEINFYIDRFIQQGQKLSAGKTKIIASTDILPEESLNMEVIFRAIRKVDGNYIEVPK